MKHKTHKDQLELVVNEIIDVQVGCYWTNINK